MMARRKYIYYVFGEDGVVCFVGVSHRPTIRLTQHKCEARMKAESGVPLYAFHAWLTREMSAGRTVHCCTIRETFDWSRDEQEEIFRLLESGVKLLNVDVHGQKSVRRNNHVRISAPGGIKREHAVMHLRAKVEPHEMAQVIRIAGGKGNVSAFIRQGLGLSPRGRGRPPKPRPRP